MYSYSYEHAIISSSLWFLLICALSVITLIVGKVLLGVAVYQNAKGCLNPNPGMWCALTIIFGFIPAIIYLCTRNSAKNRLMVCPQCNTPHPVGCTSCPQCGVHNVYAEPYYSPYAMHAIDLSKKFLIAAIVLTGAAMIGLIVGTVVTIQYMVPYISHEYHNYSHHYW